MAVVSVAVGSITRVCVGYETAQLQTRAASAWNWSVGKVF